jgi:Ca2+-binding RTX toxin-like protein
VNRIGKISALVLVSAFSITLGGSSVNAQPTSGTCNWLTPTITGSGTINGTGKADIILGSTGNDTINGGGGDDIICGGWGDDTIYGGTGNDQIWGDQEFDENTHEGDGYDWIDAGSGNDYVFDTWGSIVYAGSGNDEVYASGTMYGGSGADYLYSRQTALFVADAGTGTDTCVFDDDNVGGFVPPVSCEHLIDI